MRKGDFLRQLRAEICATVDPILAVTDRSTKGCPYLDRWFSYYGARDARHIERAVQLYAPGAEGAAQASDYIPIVVERVRRAVAVWATTGEITGVPEGLNGSVTPGGDGLPDEGPATSASAAVQLKERNGGPASTGLGRIQSRLRAGRPLDGTLRARMEHAFGRDFSSVRVHADASAAELAQGLNARAFTIGADVAFAAGQYQPGTVMGDALVAHELAHVAQQSNDDVHPHTSVVEDPALEAEADQAAIRFSLFGSSSVRTIAGLRLQRCSVPAGGGIPASIFQFEQVTGAGDPSERSLPWYAACVNITISHLATPGRIDICQFEVGFPGIHYRGRTSVAEAQTAAAEAFNECVPALIRRRAASYSAISSCVQRRMRAQIPGAKVNFPCITKMLTPTEWPTRH